jgi:rRNA-processing protein FCF1
MVVSGTRRSGHDGGMTSGVSARESVSTLDRGRGLFDGHEAYRTPTDDDYLAVLKDGLVVVDTNVLLNLYRYNAQARTDFLGVLRALRPSLWVPDQVVREFWGSREAVLRDPRGSAETLRQLDDHRSKSLNQITQWAKLASLSADGTATMAKTIREAFDAVRDAIEEHEDGENATFAQDTNSDPMPEPAAQLRL